MNDMERRTFCAALSRYGAQAQITMAFEEMAELQDVLCKFLRGRVDGDTLANIAEEIAVAQERTRWIPVTERLPEDPVQKVLIFVPHPHGNIVDVGRYLGADGWVLEGWYLTQSSVTHWMPLPEGPEEER